MVEGETSEKVEGGVATPVVAEVKRPSDVQFVEAYKVSKSPKEVVAKLAEQGLTITVSSVYARAKAYRESGVKLPEMEAGKRGRKRDVAKLNALLV